MPCQRFLLIGFPLLLLLALPQTVRAGDHEPPRPDDRVIFDLAAEDWVTTKTARVIVNVEAAVTGSTAGTMRGDMAKAVNDMVKADWRLTSFTRSQDQTGLERWSASYEARVPENALSGLGENAKKLSKAGMQLAINAIDFSPTLEETQAMYGALRTQIYKSANEQLAALNAAMPNRNYRIATINFSGDNEGVAPPPPMPVVMRGYAASASAPMMAHGGAEAAPMERAEKVTVTARIVLASAPPVVSAVAPSPVATPAAPR